MLHPPLDFLELVFGIVGHFGGFLVLDILGPLLFEYLEAVYARNILTVIGVRLKVFVGLHHSSLTIMRI